MRRAIQPTDGGSRRIWRDWRRKSREALMMASSCSIDLPLLAQYCYRAWAPSFCRHSFCPCPDHQWSGPYRRLSKRSHFIHLTGLSIATSARKLIRSLPTIPSDLGRPMRSCDWRCWRLSRWLNASGFQNSMLPLPVPVRTQKQSLNLSGPLRNAKQTL